MTTIDPGDHEARLARLEAAVFAQPTDDDTITGRPGDVTPAATTGDLDDTFWALRGLEQRTAELEHGAVLFTGSVVVGGGPVQWQYARATDDLLALGDDPDAVQPAASGPVATAASRLAAIGSPVRLQLLLAVAKGTSALADLGELDGIGTTGQVYHHVRVLTAAGWLQPAGRGRVAVPPTRLVPLLVAVAAME
ncbi:winged helix-turn-helix domain-containing protein [Plantibacter sp. ME-Dv--P-122b]|uniref:winged helix-turn-helix domain-containing protein n=1 Tax=Plantibacter sp. ME-Dv--P-122b TaxID=3040300 RepID=UPI00255189DA|nr:winged helix-turn-helix domain-containing protein [Plantibacter sp. ME-Dv--P-122b]